MVTATVRDIRLHLSKFLKLVERGDAVVIRNRSTPVARIVPYQTSTSVPFPDLTAFRNGLRKATGRKGRSVEQLIRDDREGRG